MRNVLKYAEQGEKHLSEKRRDLSAGEIWQILEKYKGIKIIDNGELLDLFATLFHFGAETGYRQATADIKANKKA